MKSRIRFNRVTIALLALALGLSLSTGAAHAARSITDVFVTNTAAAPVPAQVVGTPEVTVQNGDAPLAVELGDAPLTVEFGDAPVVIRDAGNIVQVMKTTFMGSEVGETCRDMMPPGGAPVLVTEVIVEGRGVVTASARFGGPPDGNGNPTFLDLAIPVTEVEGAGENKEGQRSLSLLVDPAGTNGAFRSVELCWVSNGSSGAARADLALVGRTIA